MYKRLVLKSDNYVYVYHSGMKPNEFCFMGMPKSDYLNSTGKYYVYCWVRVDESLSNAIQRIEEDLSSEEPNIPVGVTRIMAIQCATEFYEQVRDSYLQDFCIREYAVLIDKITQRGRVVHCTSPHNIVYAWKSNRTPVRCSDMSTRVMDMSGLLSMKHSADKPTLGELITRLPDSDLRYVLCHVTVGNGNTIVQFTNIDCDCTSEFRHVDFPWAGTEDIFVV
ncbi:MAG: hypothetical protein NC548_10755 [Lachnospiraceae bacterium]|nr:hypothetical protein [Lachnospiraceae bacterium]